VSGKRRSDRGDPAGRSAAGNERRSSAGRRLARGAWWESSRSWTWTRNTAALSQESVSRNGVVSDAGTCPLSGSLTERERAACQHAPVDHPVMKKGPDWTRGQPPWRARFRTSGGTCPQPVFGRPGSRGSRVSRASHPPSGRKGLQTTSSDGRTGARPAPSAGGPRG